MMADAHLVFAAIADDDTGASDIAGMLAAEGMRTIVVLDSAAPAQLRAWSMDADALVLAAATRAVKPEEANARTRSALELVRPLRPRVVGIKYCSTFDSTPQGNIGPSIDAALDILDQTFTVAVPALPVNGRTTYMGYHFVGQQLLSESSMRHHPLNPMTNSNLVSHLQAQTRRRVGLAPLPAVRRGVEALRQEFKALQHDGVSIAVLDCTCDADLETICGAIAEMRLITGSSGPAMMLPREWKRLGLWRETAVAAKDRAPIHSGSGALIISGSCSQATYEQCRYFEGAGGVSFALEGIELASGQFDREALVARIIAGLSTGRNVLLKTVTGDQQILAVQQWALAQGSNAIEVGLQISRALGDLAVEIFKRSIPRGLVVAGGETSGIVCRMLGVKAFSVGRNIAPGVPLCLSISAPEIPLILKSGNFGGADFFLRAADAIRSLPGVPEETSRV